MRKRKSGPENLFVSTPEEILIALLDGEMNCSKLAERADITEKHLSRILPRLEDHQLIYSKYPKMQWISRLTPKGRLVALLALEKKRALEKMKVSEEQVQELRVWGLAKTPKEGNNLAMSVDFESLSDVLKHPVRRKIILALYEKRNLSYVDLMNFVGLPTLESLIII